MGNGPRTAAVGAAAGVGSPPDGGSAPTTARSVHPAWAVFEYFLVGYRRVWRGTVFSSFLVPIMLFLGMGLMVGAMVDRGGNLDVPYLQFIAPGVLAFTGLQVAMMESAYPVLGNFKWHKIYFGMVSAPPRVGDVIVGHLAYVMVRVAVSAVAFLAVMAAFGVADSVWVVVTPLVVLLLGLAVATPMFAYSATVDTDNAMAIIFRFGMLPMMLFSGTFFPISQLPSALQPLAYATPVWHGVELCRAATLGLSTPWPVPVHLGYLVLWAVVGFVLARARFRKRLGM